MMKDKRRWSTVVWFCVHS